MEQQIKNLLRNNKIHLLQAGSVLLVFAAFVTQASRFETVSKNNASALKNVANLMVVLGMGTLTIGSTGVVLSGGRLKD
ncbi:hypothetical protein ACSYAD_35225 [Acaryochloris marina NIES-2412]|uniref:hypothetical protein n=1 Tax=Acaryochloris marina TaxID=155978 RepID=UPI0040598CAD